MRGMLSPLVRLEGEQEQASAPGHHAALAASAGTGKTHVLTARVLRLLLSGADPATILCLTFTKAGAAEMADRIHGRLAHWVRLKDQDLRKELFALRERNGPDELSAARRLFARVLEAPGGGLRIQTIHAFSQSLLASFPAEAELTPGFRPLEGREQQVLARSVLADLLVRSEQGGDHGLIDDLKALSKAYAEDQVVRLLAEAARVPDAMVSLGPREGIEARLRTHFNLPLGDLDEAIAEMCGDDRFDAAGLRRIGAMNGAWGTKTGLERADICAAWLAADPAGRATTLADLHKVWATGKGELRKFTTGAPKDPDYPVLAGAAFEACAGLLAIKSLAATVATFAATLRAGQAYAAAYAEAKRARGFVDFDDLIRGAARLLAGPGAAEWVRYKLDQRIDHILVDEAQDTNARQWEIVDQLAGEFFGGEGAGGRHRTLFTVGDFKQAIFSFQGTNPRAFDTARNRFKAMARAARDNVERLLDGTPLPPDFIDLSMDRSFRSSPQVLEAVDQVIGHLGHEAFGLPVRPGAHVSHHASRPGSVTLWKPFLVEEQEDVDDGEEGWISDTVRLFASNLAKQVKAWLDAPFMLASEKRALRPEDILILVRSRSELAGLIVARLHAEKVPVAGIDRLNLKAPLAVRDLIAAARFAVQPLDDLNLASLLVSPLIGWSQDALYAAAHDRGRDRHLWEQLREREAASDGADLSPLLAMLNMADFTAPYDFFERILSDPEGGRRVMLERLGPEARDPIEELLSSALEFESTGTPTLARFLDWFGKGDVEVVRDPSAPLDAVRVMTVHGSKGLEAPVVILADACADPDQARGAGTATLDLDEASVPVPRPRKDDLFEPLKSAVEEKEARDREEHWRLLYVAMTRARERLFVGGALGPKAKGVAPASCWHRAIGEALTGLGAAEAEDGFWRTSVHHGPAPEPGRAEAKTIAPAEPLPEWALRPAPEEARPPRPLAPSAPREDDAPYPPPTPALREAALRGKLLHRLFERLPDVAPAERRARALQWLAETGEAPEADVRAALVEDACRIIEDMRFSALFSPDALAEAPIAAVVESGDVVAGTVDRLLIEPDRILVADFKTGRSLPASADAAPPSHLRQMAAYRDALRTIFPGRRVEAALIYTAGPLFLSLSDPLLDRYAPGVERRPNSPYIGSQQI